jgi:hypothetical protein
MKKGQVASWFIFKLNATCRFLLFPIKERKKKEREMGDVERKEGGCGCV